MKQFGLFLATSCLATALATGAAAQEQQPPQDQQQQQQQQPPQQPPQQQQQPQQQPQQPQQQQQQLPRTASPMPIAGLAGALSLAAAFAIRKIRK